MGTYDTLHDGHRVEQLKLWGKGLRHLHVGDTVGLPRGGLAPDGTYTVVMRVGGFVHVVDGVVVGWREQPGPGPQLTTRGLRYDAADWPGGPLGPWYRDADAPADLRLFTGIEEECPRLARPPLRVVTSEDPLSGMEAAHAAARADVAARLRADSGDAARVEAAREFLSDGNGYRDVVTEAVAGCLGVHQQPEQAGLRLVELLSSAAGDDQWRNAAATVARYAAVLPAAAVSTCLSRLADALAEEGDEETAAGSPVDPADPDGVAHPRIRRRRADAAGAGDVLGRLRRYRDADFLGAAEAAVARHGSAVLPAVPLRFWGWDIVVTELAAPLLRPVLGRDFTSAELDWLLDALLDVPSTVASLERETLEEALQRTVTRTTPI
ncbi:hypothetical protein ACU610_21610 [Geodermatophilus sp. URMC 61]|uniref:hypothetical protein n=1 Tax=Geodermatophilus sp. URMC 61 TaxID=3423411 RepID=UPI00406C920A